MTQYAGERAHITNAVKYRGETLTPTDGFKSFVTVFNSDWVEVLTATEMPWDNARSEWHMAWLTRDAEGNPLAPGTYRALVELRQDDGVTIESWEWKRVRLARDPRPVPEPPPEP